MVERRNSGFGKRGMSDSPSVGAVRPLAGSPANVPATKPSPHVIYREGESERPSFHDSHIEKHWPKYVAGAGAAFALVYLIYDGKRDILGLILVPILFAAFSYFALNGLRKSLNNVHAVRTKMFTSPTFGIGALLGLCYFIYSTFFGGPSSTDSEIAQAVAEFQNPMTPFKDGFQQQDFGAVAILILKAAGTMALGGLIVNVIAKRFFGVGEKEGAA
jgi:hypothetical protein